MPDSSPSSSYLAPAPAQITPAKVYPMESPYSAYAPSSAPPSSYDYPVYRAPARRTDNTLLYGLAALGLAGVAMLFLAARD